MATTVETPTMGISAPKGPREYGNEFPSGNVARRFLDSIVTGRP